MATETVYVLPDESRQAAWKPVRGEQSEAICQRIAADIGDAAAQGIVDSAAKILGNCADPKGPPDHRAVLVVGHIQSGKTSSINCLTGLARDNGYDAVLILGGTTKILLNQTEQRLSEALDLSPATFADWRLIKFNKDDAEPALGQFLNVVGGTSPSGSAKPTLVISVMKEWQNLGKLATALLSPTVAPEVASWNILLVDDEADKAGLNIGVDSDQDNWSTIYRRLFEIRNAFRSVSTVQYTATPQANLLIDVDDPLSPETAILLEPGDQYTGGRAFFGPAASGLREIIPQEDLEDEEDGIYDTDSLKHALAHFWLACCIDRYELRSMLVHSDWQRAPHQATRDAINNIRGAWRASLESEIEGVRERAIQEYFGPAYSRLSENIAEPIPELEELLGQFVSISGDTRLQVVNADGASEVDWSESPRWILIGGELLGRGFTVEKLIVTYMSRGLGGFNVDSIQQRARFFGYRASYLDRCCLWLTQELEAAFSSYVDCELRLRASLRQATETDGSSLRDWRRSIVLGGPGAQPTRKAVQRIMLPNVVKFSRRFQSQQFPLVSSSGGTLQEIHETIARNRELTDALMEAVEPSAWKTYSGQSVETWGDASTVTHAVLPVEAVIEFLDQFRVNPPRDSAFLVGAQLCAAASVDSEASGIDVVRFGAWPGGGNTRTRRLIESDLEHPDLRDRRIVLQQGRGSSGGYPGDAKLKDADRVTLQVHRVDILDSLPGDQEVLVADVPVLAIFAPDPFLTVMEEDRT